MRILIYVILLLVAFVNITLALPRLFDSDLTGGETSLNPTTRDARKGTWCTVGIKLIESDSSNFKDRDVKIVTRIIGPDNKEIKNLK